MFQTTSSFKANFQNLPSIEAVEKVYIIGHK